MSRVELHLSATVPQRRRVSLINLAFALLDRLHNLPQLAVPISLDAGDDLLVQEVLRTMEDWLADFLDLPHGIPSHDTFNRVFSALDPEQ